MDHDRLFKELLANFFMEFVDLFLPNVSAFLDKDFTVVPLDKEIFTDVTFGERHEVDLVMKAKFRGQETFFLIHVENQATTQADFPKRMFRYFARLTEKYDLPVYPVVIFSHDTPLRAEPKQYRVDFPGKTILRFEYAVVQLNRLSWRRFARQDNPVAGALMAKMKMSARDRPKVRLECLRLMARLTLDPARSKLIGGFIDSYLRLTAQEMAQYEREFARLEPAEREATMGLVSSWEQKGITQGKEELVARQLRHRFGVISEAITEQLDRLSPERLDDLGEALLDFAGPADLERWLLQH